MGDKYDSRLDSLRALAALGQMPLPSDQSFARASEILKWVDSQSLKLDDIDVDVLGGITIMIHGVNGNRRAWIACMNGGSTSIVFTDALDVTAERWDDNGQDKCLKFLNEKKGTLT